MRMPPILALLLTIAASSAYGQTSARLSGVARDTSGSVLPGVTVSIGPEHGEATASTVTDQEGLYELTSLATGVFLVSFELSGFETQTERVVLSPGDAIAVDATLHVGGMHETVTVVAEPVPPSPAIPLLQARSIPQAQPIAEHASVCGPREAEAPGQPVGRVMAIDQDPGRVVLGDRDVLVIDAGQADGLTVGQNFVVRRASLIERRTGRVPKKWTAEFTAALVQVVETGEHSATARALYVCHEIQVGDRLEPFAAEPLVRAAAGGTPDLADAGRVLFGNEGRSIAAPLEYMVIDRGSRHGAHPGQWVTMLRGTSAFGRTVVIGNALVVAVQPNSATIRIQSARDAIEIGDTAALHR